MANNNSALETVANDIAKSLGLKTYFVDGVSITTNNSNSSTKLKLFVSEAWCESDTDTEEAGERLVLNEWNEMPNGDTLTGMAQDNYFVFKLAETAEASGAPVNWRTQVDPLGSNLVNKTLYDFYRDGIAVDTFNPDDGEQQYNNYIVIGGLADDTTEDVSVDVNIKDIDRIINYNIHLLFDV